MYLRGLVQHMGCIGIIVYSNMSLFVSCRWIQFNQLLLPRLTKRYYLLSGQAGASEVYRKEVWMLTNDTKYAVRLVHYVAAVKKIKEEVWRVLLLLTHLVSYLWSVTRGA